MSKKIIYIAEFSPPNNSAYSLQVFKMCDSFNELGYQTILLLPHNNSKFSYIKKIFLLKKNPLIINIFKNNIQLNFFFRILFAVKCLNFIKKIKNPFLLYSRSIVSSLILCIFGFKNTLEIHHEIKGFSRIFFYILKFQFFNKNIKIILIHKNLKKVIYLKKIKYSIIPSATDPRDFQGLKFEKLKKSCVYMGSMYKGKGVELIYKIANKLPNINFYIYGKNNGYKERLLKKKNIYIYPHIPYRNVPKTLSRFHVALMPYQNKVEARSNNLEISKFMSPLKMFDYMASKIIIVASRLSNYKDFINERNSILCNPSNENDWVKKISLIFRNLKKYKYLKQKSIKIVNSNTWIKRAEKIINSF
jgi:hypothetical protein